MGKRKERPARARQDEEGAGQAIWSGTIGFSLVAIPVRLVKAVEPGRVAFRMLHKKDYSPLLRRMYCPAEEKMVPQEEIVRGYEVAPDKFVTITDAELESVSPERSRTIEILEFIDLKEVDRIYYQHPYYLVPAKGGEKAYRLLVEALRRTNKAGLARFVLAEREHLVAIKSENGALGLMTLHYRDEILPDEGLAPGEGKREAAEESRVKNEVKRMLADFRPGKYADLRRTKLVELLHRKAGKQPPVEAPKVEGREEEAPLDLVAALRVAMHKRKKKP